ncbi:MAG: magnesium transporter [Anaerolineae bacterium]
MEMSVVDQALEQVRERLAANDLVGAIAIIEALRPPDQAEVFSDLPPEQQETLLPQLSVPDAADILEELEDEDAAELASRLHPEALADILDEMEPDEAADLLGDLEPPQMMDVLSRMEDAEEIRPLLLHRDETAGGLMTSEFLALRTRMTVREALNTVRRWDGEADLAYLFVVDRDDRLQGVVSLFHLIRANPEARLDTLMDPDVIYIHTGADQEECARLMSRYDLSALPVVDADRRLRGVITWDDLVEVLEDEATEDFERFGGTLPLGKPYLDTGAFEIARRRFGWLLLLFITETFTGTVLRHFEKELDAVVALAYFVPLLIGTGGNAGTQCTSTIIRALALGDITFRDALRVWWHEVRVGFLLGLGMATVAFLRALTWGSGDALATTVALSILVIVVWANFMGSFLPLLASKFKIDPAVISGPAMTTLVDATGLMIYLVLAKHILHL